jgi:uncharacterized repeat protein (TIGR01451 family)/uncharacterized delta-60 repeat protein
MNIHQHVVGVNFETVLARVKCDAYARRCGSVITLAAVLFVGAILAPAVRAQNAGSLDTTFNSPNGFVAVDVSGSGQDNFGAATAIDSKGRIVVVGGVAEQSNGFWSLVRYNKDGTPDSTFGNDGKVVTTIAGLAKAVAIDSSDNILVAGLTTNTTTNISDFTVAKFLTADGSLDVLNYGKAGLAVLDIATVNLNAKAIGIDSAGGTIVAGDATSASNFALFGAALARFDKTGTLDMSFGNQSSPSGYILLTFGTTPAVAIASALVIGPVSGRIVVAGFSTSADSEDFALARFMSNGTLDTSFGASGTVPGTVLTDFSNAGSSDFASAVALTEDTSGVMTIVAAGESDAAGAKEFALARYNDDGSLDTTFGTDNSGKVITSFAGVVTGALAGSEQDSATAVAIDSQRRIVTSGLISYDNSLGFQFVDLGLARYDTTGNLDTSFGSGGLVDQSFVTPLNNFNNVALALDGDGNLLTASNLSILDDGEFLIARFLGQALTADLQLTKQVSPSTANPGDTVAYTISVTNAGPNPAQGVRITDILPAGVTFFSCTAPMGSTCNHSANNVVVTFTSLPVSTTPATITISATVNSGTAGQTISNTASLASATTNTGNASASASFQVPSADLAITDQVSPSVVAPGGLVTYTLTVTNNGPSDATGGVAVSDTLPSQVTFMSCSATASGVCGGSGNSQSVTFPSLKNSASATITFTATLNNGVANGTSVSDTANVASTGGIPDPNTANNTSAAATFVVLNQADLAVSLSVAKGSGRQQTYTVSVKNNGPFAAAQLVLSDSIPTGTTFASIAPGAWNCSTPAPGGKGTVSCTLSGLAPNVTTSFKFVVNATVSGSASITDTATVSAATFDPNGANNSATLTSKAN